METEEILTKYLSTWFWHLSSIIFLVGSFIILFSGEEVGNVVFWFALLVIAIVCEIIAYDRKRKFDELKGEETLEYEVI